MNTSVMSNTGNLFKMSNNSVFYIVLTLALALSVHDVGDSGAQDKALPICTLVINLLVIVVILLQQFYSIPALNNKLYLYLMPMIVLILSFILSIDNVSDNEKYNKSLHVLVLIINSLAMLFMFYTMIKK